MTLVGVAGWPVGHSRSPAMQNAAFRELGIDWLYVKLPVAPELFEETVRALPASGFAGLNVTIPHKEAAFRLADEASPAARAIGAANTLTFSDGRIEAHNTDAGGLLDALEGTPAADPSGLRALVLGAGGAGRAAAWALRDAGARVALWNRTAERAAVVAGDLGVEAVENPLDADLVVNATSVGLDPAVPDGQALTQLGLDALAARGTVVDLVYRPSETPVCRWGREGGAAVVDGVEVLVRQGARSLALWTGCTPPVRVMREAAGSR